MVVSEMNWEEVSDRPRPRTPVASPEAAGRLSFHADVSRLNGLRVGTLQRGRGDHRPPHLPHPPRHGNPEPPPLGRRFHLLWPGPHRARPTLIAKAAPEAADSPVTAR